jgi:hypothetical protein
MITAARRKATPAKHKAIDHCAHSPANTVNLQQLQYNRRKLSIRHRILSLWLRNMDRITQLQDAIDQVSTFSQEITDNLQMATQFYSALHYLNTHHDFVSVNDNPPVTDSESALPPAGETDSSYPRFTRDVCLLLLTRCFSL